ncbi:MAG TPA: hypothetical protein VLA78_14750 [Paracoccaceae bacterium]|nr:hypothetical protein [Paracoccaceae bacterium]
MRIPLLAALAIGMTLSGCGTVRESRLNPFNWFGGSEEAEPQPALPGAPVDRRILVDNVVAMAVERMPGGVIVRATGLPPTQGYWEAELVARPVEGGQIVYDFRVFPPVTRQAVSTQQSREVEVATFLSDFRMESEGIRQITVQGATNARTSRR